MNDLMNLQGTQISETLAQQCGQFLTILQVFYGDDFDKKYGKLDENSMIVGVAMVLDGLTAKEYQVGLNRMKTEKWCPTLPEFRSWCVAGSDWWGTEYAWAKALEFLNDKTVKITKLAKASLDKVQNIMHNEGQSNAHKAFREIYEKFLYQAKKEGRVQEFYVPQNMIAEQPIEKRTDVIAMPEILLQAKNKIVMQENEKIIAQFQTINDFYAEHGRYPSNDKIAEMSMYRQLDMFKSDKKISALLKPYDVHGLIFGKKVA